MDTCISQLFSDPGQKREPFFGKTTLVGPPKKRGTLIGATEQLRKERALGQGLGIQDCPFRSSP